MKTSKKFLAIIIPLLVIIPMLVGYSLWLVGEKREEIPTYTFKDLLENNVTLSATYTGSELDITKEDVQKTFKVKFDIDWSSFNVTYWDTEGNNPATPKNAGKYTVKITSIYEEVNEGATKETAVLNFEIKKATPNIDLSKIKVTAEEGKECITTSSVISKLRVTPEDSAANFNGNNVAGSFKLEEGQELQVGNKEYTCTFYPAEEAENNFNEITFDIQINTFATVTLELNKSNNVEAGSGFDVNNNPLYIDTTDNVKNKLNSGSISKGIVAAIHYQFIADNGWFVKDSSGNVAERWDFKELVDKDIVLVAIASPIEYGIGYEVVL